MDELSDFWQEILDNDRVLYALMDFVSDHNAGDYSSIFAHLQQIQHNHGYGSSGKMVYRGTKVGKDAIPIIIAGHPFTLKATRDYRSWSTSEESARSFMDEPPRFTMGLLLEEINTYNDTIIDLDQLEHNFMELMEWAAENDPGLNNSLEDIANEIFNEAEVIRWVETKQYQLWDSIIEITIQDYDEVDDDFVSRIKDPDQQEEFRHLADTNEVAHLQCLPGGKLQIKQGYF